MNTSGYHIHKHDHDEQDGPSGASPPPAAPPLPPERPSLAATRHPDCAQIQLQGHRSRGLTRAKSYETEGFTSDPLMTDARTFARAMRNGCHPVLSSMYCEVSQTSSRNGGGGSRPRQEFLLKNPPGQSFFACSRRPIRELQSGDWLDTGKLNFRYSGRGPRLGTDLDHVANAGGPDRLAWLRRVSIRYLNPHYEQMRGPPFLERGVTQGRAGRRAKDAEIIADMRLRGFEHFEGVALQDCSSALPTLAQHCEGGAVHPIVRRHPETGEECLYVHCGAAGVAGISAPERTIPAEHQERKTGVEANGPEVDDVLVDEDPMGHAQTQALLGELLASTCEADTSWGECPFYKHTWEPGDLLVWDNRLVLFSEGPETGMKSVKQVFHVIRLPAPRDQNLDCVECWSMAARAAMAGKTKSV